MDWEARGVITEKLCVKICLTPSNPKATETLLSPHALFFSRSEEEADDPS